MSADLGRSDAHGLSSTLEVAPSEDERPPERGNVREHRVAATTAGILYITGTVAGVLVRVTTYSPVHTADDPFAYALQHSDAVTTGALLVLVMGLSLAFVPVVLFPLLRRVNEVLATGYLIIRGAVETACYIIIAIAWLVFVPLGETMSAGPGTASPAATRLGTLVTDFDGAQAMTALVFCLGGAMFYALLYRSRIVPRWIAVWGFVGIPFYVAAYLLAMYGVIGGNSSELNLLTLPLALQEMVLAIWMIARGFRPAAGSATSGARSGGTSRRTPPPWFVHTFWRVHRGLYRFSGGRFLWTPASKRGWGALHLTTVGRRSGKQRSVIVGYLEDGSNFVTLAMNGWDDGYPAWWLNLEAHPDAVVRLAHQGARPVHARAAVGEERERLWDRWIAVDPDNDASAATKSRETPVVVLEPRPT
jgi:deazaflavin-dependent oxidoreductase (nitroreductase family)